MRVSTLSDLVLAQGRNSAEDVDWLHMLVADGQLLADLRAALPGMAVESTLAHGLDPDFVEAMAFAWLARETVAGRPGNLIEVTGARGPRVLGCLYPGGLGPGFGSSNI